MAMPTCYVSGVILDRVGEMIERAPGVVIKISVIA